MRLTARMIAPALLVVVALGATACGGGSGAASSGTGGGSGGATSTTLWTKLKKPLPAGPHPSSIAIEVCAKMAQQEMSAALGETASVSPPTWSPTTHLYACHYRYSGGSFSLSVKELSSWSQTYAYYKAQRSSLGFTGNLGNLGQGAFATKNGSVVVRKDWKVLYVNIDGLPSHFGKPPTSRADVAVTIADVILGCWAGD